MKSLTKVLIVLIVAGLFAGCQLEEGDSLTGGVQVYCDKEKGVEYLFAKDGYSGGLSLRYNSDGFVSKCR